MSDWTEAQIIEEISRIFPMRSEIVERGIGDDCALMHDGMKLITTDASIEGVHFDLHWMTLADAAYRCMTSNVSDIAAMGAFAGPFTLALGLPVSLEFDEIRLAISAIKKCIEDHRLPDCWLIGGDVVRCDSAMFSVTVLAKCPEWPVVYRNTASPGDAIIALGHLGYAAAGLDLFKSGLFRNDSLISEFDLFPLLNAFRRPLALTQFGPLIAQNRCISAMMDLSDGIRTDLPRLLAQSHCGADVFLDRLIPDNRLLNASELVHCDPMDWMICGGEDFGLLVTSKTPEIVFKFANEQHIPCCILGLCTDKPDISWFENGRYSTRKNISFSHF